MGSRSITWGMVVLGLALTAGSRADAPIAPATVVGIAHPHRAAWERRRSEAAGSTVAARHAAAWWALDHGLTAEAEAALVALRPEADAHPPTGRAVAMLDQLARPCAEPDLGPIRRHLRPGRFREVRTDHVVLLHQADDDRARARADLIERVLRTFCLTFAGEGFPITVPGRRVVSVWFADADAYRAVLRRSEASAFGDTQGFYHPTLRVVLAFDVAATARRPDRVAELEEVNALIIAHETAHQLVMATGLAPRFDAFPPWLHEGLAMQFEVVRDGHWLGIGRVNGRRLDAWRATRPAPRLAPLLRSEPPPGYDQHRYAAWWALTYHLRTDRPTEFAAFLDLLRLPQPADAVDHPAFGLRPEAALAAALGGSLADVEVDWHRAIAALPGPEPAGPTATGLDRRGPTD